MTEQNENTAEKPAGGSKKLLIIGLVLGLLLGGGGGFGAVMMMGDDGAEKKADKIIIEKPKADPHFVKMEHVTLPLVDNNRVVGNMVLEFSLEVDGNDNKLKVVRNLPEIRDALLRHYSQTAIGKSDSPKNVDYPRLKKTLLTISNDILHEKLVKRVMVVQARHY